MAEVMSVPGTLLDRARPRRGQGLESTLRLRPGSRRNKAVAILGVVMVAGFGLVSRAMVNAAGKRIAVLAVTQAVPAGSRLTRDDLKTVLISVDPALDPIPAQELPQVVSQIAQVALVPGDFLTPAQLDQRPPIPHGESVVPLFLKPGQYPQVVPGDKVLVVFGGAAAGTLSPSPQGGSAVGVTVYAMDTNTGSSGETRVSLLVDQATAISLAVYASAPITLIRLGPQS